VRDGTPTLVPVRQRGQAERLDELLNEDAWSPHPAALVLGVLGGGFIVPGESGALRVLTDHEIFRRERRSVASAATRAGRRSTSAAPSRPATSSCTSSTGSASTAASRPSSSAPSTIEVAVIEYEGGDKLNVPLYRLDQIERYRAAGDVADDAPAPRLHSSEGGAGRSSATRRARPSRR
jgi:transcription-repair coupling factor (superfamily II helicase)